MTNSQENKGRTLGEQGFVPQPGLSPVANAASLSELAGGRSLQSPTLKPKSPCGACAAAGKSGPCAGHGGAGGGDPAASDSNHATNADDIAAADELKEKLDLERLIDTFEFTVNPENNSLSIAPKPGANLRPEEVAAYFAKLDQHFDDFQKQFPNAQGFSRELIGNVMTYTIPAQHYPEFIQSLVKAGLAPAFVAQQPNNVKIQQAALLPVPSFQEEKARSPLQDYSLFAHKPQPTAFKPPVLTFSGGAKAADDEKQHVASSFGRSAAAA